MSTFQKAYEFVRREEGGYANHPDDPGGATNFGVTQARYDQYRRRPVKLISEDEVQDIYRQYWRDARCDAIEKIAPSVAIVHFDSAFNVGVGQAAKLLQRAARVTDDGVIGPATLAAIDGVDESTLVKRLIEERTKFYESIAKRKRPDGRNPGVFLKVWLGRVRRVAKLVGV